VGCGKLFECLAVERTTTFEHVLSVGSIYMISNRLKCGNRNGCGARRTVL